MIVAMSSVPAVHVAGDHVVDVARMRNRVVSAAYPVQVIGCVPPACMALRARIGVSRRSEQFMFVDMLVVHVVEVSVMHVIDVILVVDAQVSAFRAVAVLVLMVNVMLHDALRIPQTARRLQLAAALRAAALQAAQTPNNVRS